MYEVMSVRGRRTMSRRSRSATTFASARLVFIGGQTNGLQLRMGNSVAKWSDDSGYL